MLTYRGTYIRTYAYIGEHNKYANQEIMAVLVSFRKLENSKEPKRNQRVFVGDVWYLEYTRNFYQLFSTTLFKLNTSKYRTYKWYVVHRSWFKARYQVPGIPGIIYLESGYVKVWELKLLFLPIRRRKIRAVFFVFMLRSTRYPGIYLRPVSYTHLTLPTILRV